MSLSEISDLLRKIGRIEKLGGADSFFGRLEIFQQILYNKHDEAGLANTGMYSFKGMGQYGNIVSMEPLQSALEMIRECGFSDEDISEIKDWYESGPECRGAIDEGVAAIAIQCFLDGKSIS